ncbi:hypothetical protein Tco_1522702, partial [Tanacetum coccineum]
VFWASYNKTDCITSTTWGSDLLTLLVCITSASSGKKSKYGDSDGYTFDDPILILEILSRRFLLRGIYLITGSSKDGDGDTSFQWSQFTTQCSHLMFLSKDIMTTE